MKNYKVVLIDDDQDFTEALRIFLEGRGMQVWVAGNGQEGLALAREVQPDIILLDIMMDYLNEGFVVAGEIKKDPVLSKKPVVFITGFEQHMEENLDTFSMALAEWNAAAIMSKPIEPAELAEKIQKILG